MDFLYSNADILDQYDDGSRITCVLNHCTSSQPWRSAYPDLSHEQLFTYSDHPMLEEMLAARQQTLRTSVALGGLQMLSAHAVATLQALGKRC